MTYISRCKHGTPMALCQKCFPDVSEHNDWSNYQHTHPVKELTDEEIKQIWYDLYPLSSSSYWDDKREGLAELKFARAILRKAQEK